MAVASQREELVDIVVRLPRATIEELLLPQPGSDIETASRRLVTAKAILAGRRRRSESFAGVRFYDPSWDMMLELYVASCERRTLAVSQLCSLSGGSTTTALRHIEHLEALGYLSREADPADRRRLIVLTLPTLEKAFERWIDLQISGSQLGL